MSENGRPNQADDSYVTDFSYPRNYIKKVIEDHPTLVNDATSLIAQMTIFSMIVAGLLDVIVNEYSVKCGNGDYRTPAFSLQMLKLAGFMLLFEIVGKLVGNKEESSLLTKLVTLLCFNVGILALYVYWPQYRNHTCFEYEVSSYENTFPNTISANMEDFLENRSLLWKKCIFYGGHCAIQYLRQQLNVLVCFCSITWALNFCIFCAYIYQLCIPEEPESEAVPSGETAPTDHILSSPEDSSKTSSKIPRMASFESLHSPKSRKVLPSAGSEPSAAVTSDPGSSTEAESNVYSSPSSSSPQRRGKKFEMRKLVRLGPTGKCSFCGAFQKQLRRESPSLTSSDTASSPEQRPVTKPLPQQPSTGPKFCHECGSQFVYD